MPKTATIAAVSLLILFSSSLLLAAPPTGTWAIQQGKSLVSFQVSKFGYSDVKGQFRDFSGEITYDPLVPAASSIRWDIRMASVKTDEPGRDQSLQSENYFDSAKYPKMSFVSRKVRALDNGRLEVAGLITIKGKSQLLTTIVQPLPSGDGFETRFDLDRYDFDITGGIGGRAAIGSTVHVHLIARAK